MDVVPVLWPEDNDRRLELHAVGTPRLLLVDQDVPPPEPLDCLEDWVRLSADDHEVRARVATLAARAEHIGLRPRIEPHGILRYQGQWVVLSPTEAALTASLIEQFGAVVKPDVLTRSAPAGLTTRHALTVQLARVRSRLAPLGLAVFSVRSRGYVLDRSSHPPSLLPARCTASTP